MSQFASDFPIRCSCECYPLRHLSCAHDSDCDCDCDNGDNGDDGDDGDDVRDSRVQRQRLDWS